MHELRLHKVRVNEEILRKVIIDVFLRRTRYFMPLFADWLELRIAGYTETCKDETFWRYLDIIRRNYIYRMKREKVT